MLVHGIIKQQQDLICIKVITEVHNQRLLLGKQKDTYID